MARKKILVETICTICMKKFVSPKKRLRKTCSEECRRRKSSQTMSATNIRRRIIISQRMRDDNPMSNPEIRNRARERLLEMGHRPRVRGGNGCGPTMPQKLLNDILGWSLEVVIPTFKKKGQGYPTAYKVDIANLERKIAVEVDGDSHCALKRKAQDSRKDEVLTGLGFKVLRLRNSVILADPEGCAARALALILK